MGPILRNLRERVVTHVSGHINQIPTLSDILKSKLNHNVDEDEMVVWDKGVFMIELHRQGFMIDNSKGSADGQVVARKGLQQGTYQGTRMALTEVYSMMEESYATPST
jgi:hypothetical protein